jgi:glycosyltransferase involved in cell wall biosynthesis
MLKGFDGQNATPVSPMVRQWLENGHEVAVFCLDQSVVSPQILTGTRLSVHVLPKRRARSYMLDVYKKERALIVNAIKYENPDVISAQWSYEHAMGAQDSELPCVVTCHDTPLRYAWNAKNFYMCYHLLIARHVIRKAKHLICVSPYTADHIKKIFQPKGTLSIIPNGLPEELFLRGKSRFLNKRPTSSIFTICSIGGWGRLKNIKSLLKAYALLRQKHPNTRLVLFGSQLGSLERGEMWARANHFDIGVEFRGVTPRQQLFDFLEYEADLMMHPSKIETHGMVLIEAMACGVPVIAGQRSGAVPWTLDHGKSGILCDIRQPKVIAEAIEQILMNPERTQSIVHHAWHSTYDRFRIVNAAAANEKLLLEIATNSALSKCP